jgi:hypothetical protein
LSRWFTTMFFCLAFGQAWGSPLVIPPMSFGNKVTLSFAALSGNEYAGTVSLLPGADFTIAGVNFVAVGDEVYLEKSPGMSSFNGMFIFGTMGVGQFDSWVQPGGSFSFAVSSPNGGSSIAGASWGITLGGAPPVPEPSSTALVLSGMSLLGWLAWKNRTRTADLVRA